MQNRTLGNRFETEFCDLLYRKGFWVHNMAQNAHGQPADVIAVINGRSYLIDCKVCSNNKFAFSRVEDNQDSAMELWEDCGNGVGWFALKLNSGDIYMVSLRTIRTMSMRQSAMNAVDIEKYGIKLDQWIQWSKI